MKNLVTWFEYQHQAKSYDRHFLHVNFTRFQRFVTDTRHKIKRHLIQNTITFRYTKNLRPTYINIVRDPAEREYSAFRGRRSQDPLQITQEIKRRDAAGAGTGSWSKDGSSLHQCWHFHWCRNGMVHKILWRLHSWWGSWMCLQLFRVHLQPGNSIFLRAGSTMPVWKKKQTAWSVGQQSNHAP